MWEVATTNARSMAMGSSPLSPFIITSSTIGIQSGVPWQPQKGFKFHYLLEDFCEERHEGGMCLGIKDGSLNLDCKIE